MCTSLNLDSRTGTSSPTAPVQASRLATNNLNPSFHVISVSISLFIRSRIFSGVGTSSGLSKGYFPLSLSRLTMSRASTSLSSSLLLQTPSFNAFAFRRFARFGLGGGVSALLYDDVPIPSSRSRSKSKDESEPASSESESLMQGVAGGELAALGRHEPRLPLRWSANFEVGGGGGVNTQSVETLSNIVRTEWRASDRSVLESVVSGAMRTDFLGREGMVCSLRRLSVRSRGPVEGGRCRCIIIGCTVRNGSYRTKPQ